MKKIIIFLIVWLFCVSSMFALDLRITEVFVDGSDERVEITNIEPTEFVWSFQLSGVKSSLLPVWPVTISPMSTLLVGDNLSMLSTPHNLNILWGRGLSLWDSAWVNISLIDDSGLVRDTFLVDQSLVQSVDNTMTSFQKLYNGWWFDIVTTLSPFSVWVTPPSIANPGQVYHTDGSVRLPMSSSWTGSSSGSWSQDSDWTTTGWIVTWSQSSWRSVDCTMAWSGVVVVDEIHFGTQYTPYIELLFLQDRNGSLWFSWTALVWWFTIPSQSYKANMRYLIASSSSWLVHTEHIIIVPWLQVVSWNLMISSDMGWATYYANIDSTWQSVYFWSNEDCIQYITSPGSPSPWFDRQFLWYFNTQTITTTIIQPWTGSCVTGSTSSGSWTSSYSWTITPETTTLSGIFVFHDVRISLIDYDPEGSDTNNERLWLTLFTWESVSLSGWSLWYDGKTYKFLSWMLMSGTEYIRTANFGFVNSRTVCISLYYLGIVIDTVCYDPAVQSSPVTPLHSSWSMMTWDVISGDTETFYYKDLKFKIISLVYDPDGSDTDRETVTIHFSGWTTGVDLSLFRLRVGTTNKRIYGIILSGQTLTLMGNFQMPNTRATCVALSYNEIIYDEYCYNPVVSTSSSPSSPNPYTDTLLYTNRTIQIVALDYDPEGNDTDREMVVLLMTGWQSAVDVSKLYLRFGTTKRYLNGTLYADLQTTITGNYQMPNSKPTCVDLMEWSHLFDTYCYDPLWDDPIALISTGTLQTWDQMITDRKEYYSGLQLQRILPNPQDKDIKNLNEKFALSWKDWSGQILTKQVKLLVGKTSISLSWYQFIDDELIIASSKSLTNQAACMRLMIDNQEIDTLCYPQAKEWLVYYHPRLQTWPQTIPSSLIASLDSQWVDLSDLVLKKFGKQICLTYNTVQIRCMNGWSTATSAKNKALLTLWNAYIKKMSELVATKELDYGVMEQRRTSYRILSDEIKRWNVSNITLYGQSLKVTDLESYVTTVYMIDEEEYMTDQFASLLFWHQSVDEYYRELYK